MIITILHLVVIAFILCMILFLTCFRLSDEDKRGAINAITVSLAIEIVVLLLFN